MATGHGAQVDTSIAAGRKKTGKTFVKDIKDWVAKANGDVDEVIRAIAISLCMRVLLRTPIDTGWTRDNWRYSPGTPNLTIIEKKDVSSWTNTSGPGSNRAKQSLIEQLANYDPARDGPIFYVNPLPHMLRLEYGWSKMQAPEGMVRIVVAGFLDIVKEEVTLVRSRPGKKKS